MGHRLIRQANGRLAVFSDVVDNLVLYDCTEEEIVEHYAQEAAERARRDALLWVKGEAPGRKIYTVEQAMDWCRSGAMDDPDVDLEWKQKAQARLDAVRAVLENPN